MTVTEWIVSVGGGLLGGAGIALREHFTTRRLEAAANADAVAGLKTSVEECNRKHGECEERCDVIREEVKELRNEFLGQAHGVPTSKHRK